MENRIKGEVLSPAELGEKTYAAITDITTRLQGVPEFGAALHKSFFNRDKNDSGCVYFAKGDYGYTIIFESESSPNFQEDQGSSVTVRLHIIKHQPSFLYDATIGEIDLTTSFTENQGGEKEISEYKGGNAHIVTGRKEIGHNGDSALHEIPEFLKDLFSPTKI